MERAIWSGWRHWAPALAFMVGLMLALVSLVLAADDLERLDQLQRPSLAGLTGVYVVVEDIEPDAERDGLAQSTLRTDVELKLRQAGMRVLSKDEWLAATGFPNLYLNVNTLKDRMGTYAFCIDLVLKQEVRLTRNPAITFRGITWEAAGVVGTVGPENLHRVRDHVRDRVDKFINAYLAANPKK